VSDGDDLVTTNTTATAALVVEEVWCQVAHDAPPENRCGQKDYGCAGTIRSCAMTGAAQRLMFAIGGLASSYLVVAAFLRDVGNRWIDRFADCRSVD
jgi:hypothetical protein